jgi:hypothetical protein
MTYRAMWPQCTCSASPPDRIVFEDNEGEFEKRLFSRNGLKADYLVERRQHAL